MNAQELSNTRELSRLMWRYESGFYPEITVSERFEDEVNRLESIIVGWRPALRSLRHSPSLAMAGCDDAINRAQNSCNSKDYRGALGQIRKAQNLLAQLKDVLEASAEY